MELTFDPHARKRAAVYANDDFVCVQSSAGYRSTVDDKIVAYLPPSVTEAEIGRAVLSALESYRVLSVSELDDLKALEECA